MEVNFDDLSDDIVDSDQLKDYDIEFNDDVSFDDSFFDKQSHDKVITDTHKKLMEYKKKFEEVRLYTLMELNVEYQNYYNGLKTITINDNTCILDVPIIKMDVEQIDEIIIKKQTLRSSKEIKIGKGPKKFEEKSFFKWKFGH